MWRFIRNQSEISLVLSLDARPVFLTCGSRLSQTVVGFKDLFVSATTTSTTSDLPSDPTSVSSKPDAADSIAFDRRILTCLKCWKQLIYWGKDSRYYVEKNSKRIGTHQIQLDVVVVADWMSLQGVFGDQWCFYCPCSMEMYLHSYLYGQYCERISSCATSMTING